jgi:uncharacterized protein (DUF1778 family)
VGKAEFIHVRVDADAKARIVEAAAREGKNVTTFVLDAAMREAARVERKPRGQFTGVPTFFRALCREATLG